MESSSTKINLSKRWLGFPLDLFTTEFHFQYISFAELHPNSFAMTKFAV